MPQRDSPVLKAGDRLGPYEILSPLGAGGMGEVYRARDSRLEREIAIKTLPERLHRDPDALARFEREARAVAALSHPNILAIHDFGEENGICYCVMELLEGETLRDRLRAGPIPVKQAVDWAHQIAQGLAAAHEKGIVHRDLKPENLFLTHEGRVKILDFGLARVRPAAEARTGDLSESPTEVRPTDPGTLLGTVGYMSPEQVRGEEADARSDLFSFGCVLYEMITGRRAFSRPTAAETLAAILQEEPEGLWDEGVLPEELQRIAAHCLEKTPSERFQSARDLAYELKSLQESRPGRAGRKSRRSVPRSLAILPFENASGDPEAEYLSEGLTEGLINALAPLPGLRVRARNTVYRYKGRHSDPREAGRDLQVEGVVTGRLLVRGESLSLQVELVDCSDGSQLWGEQFQRSLAEVFTLQEDILQGVSRSLRLRRARRAAPSRRAPKGGARTYNLYLEGRYYWNKRTEEAYLKGIELFERTLREDPRYAPAYAGLSDCYTFLGGYGHFRPRDAFARAKEAALRALEIDDSLDEAHNSLGIVLHRFDWNWAAADREFSRALRLNPANVTAHHWYGVFLLTMGRFEEAMAEVAKARELDPLSLVARQDAGYIHFCRREYLRAAEECREILRIEPSFTPARFDLGLALAMAGHAEEAISETRQAADQAGRRPRGLAQLAYVLARVGRREEAAGLLAQLTAGDPEAYVPRFSLALVQVALGNLEEAFRWLELSYEEHEDALVSVRVNPRLEPLRPDPRFRELERRIGF